IGRPDVATVARQAAAMNDLDAGLASLLTRLPTDALRPPKLGLLSTLEDLGTLEPGKDQQLQVVITNQGMLVLSGTVLTECDWLSFGERRGNACEKMFQTRDTFNLVVRVVGDKLRAMQKPLLGRIVIQSNGGDREVLVQATVPVRPFPWWVGANGL